MSQMRTRSASRLPPTASSDGAPPKKTTDKKMTTAVEQRSTRSRGAAIFRGTDICSIARDGLRQTDATQSTPQGHPMENQAPAPCASTSGLDGRNTTAAALRTRRQRQAVADRAIPTTRDYDSLARTQYNLRSSKTPTASTSAEYPHDSGCKLRSFYKHIFAGYNKKTPTTSKNLVAGGDHRMLLTDQAADRSTSSYALRSSRGAPEGNAASSDAVPFCDSTAQGDDASGMLRSCLKKRDPSGRMVSDEDGSVKPESFVYVLRNDHCLLKQKQSIIERLRRNFERSKRSKSEKQGSNNNNGDPVRLHTLTSLDRNTGCYSGRHRRVRFLEPERASQLGNEAEVMGQLSNVPASSLDLSGKGQATKTDEDASEEVDDGSRPIWSRSSTALLAILIGLRMLYDAWSDSFHLYSGFGYLPWFGNKSSEN